MSKIFPKIYLMFDLKCFHSIVFNVLLLLWGQKLKFVRWALSPIC